MKDKAEALETSAAGWRTAHKTSRIVGYAGEQCDTASARGIGTSMAPPEMGKSRQACTGKLKHWSKDMHGLRGAVPPVRFLRYKRCVTLGSLLLRGRFSGPGV